MRQIDGIAEACILPSPDREIGNKIRAVVVLKDHNRNKSIDAKFIREELKKFIAPYKVPQIIEFMEALPKSPVGKVLRRVLTDA